MAFTDFQEQEQGVQLLQRSLARGRVAHAYLFTGHQLASLETLARTLAKTLNCREPKIDAKTQRPVDCCDSCLTCRKIDGDNHADVHWLRPESKSRVIVIDQVRELSREIFLKPTEAEYKVAILVAADRLNPHAANAFLKTLEEPPAKSILILLSTDPQRLLETILSRCLRLNFGGDDIGQVTPEQRAWMQGFSELAAAGHEGLLGRYRLLDRLMQNLSAAKESIETSLADRSPLNRYPDAEPDTRKKWEEELTAAIEAEYRLQRTTLLAVVQWWMRDVWLQTIATDRGLLKFPDLSGTGEVAGRISPRQAMNNLRTLEQTQRLLNTNVQEALALEVGLLKLHL